LRLDLEARERAEAHFTEHQATLSFLLPCADRH
jgi:hypothetical protein